MCQKFFGTWFTTFVVKRILLAPFSLYPFVGIFASAWFKAQGTAKYLHKQYFESKKMTPYQTAVFIEERKWDYLSFGFAAALVEGLPIIGLVFSVSNRIGAAMWAHDLEKRQHYFAEKKLAAVAQSTAPETARSRNPSSTSSSDDSFIHVDEKR